MQVMQVLTYAGGFPSCISLDADTCVNVARVWIDQADLSLETRPGMVRPLGSITKTPEGAAKITHVGVGVEWVPVGQDLFCTSLDEVIQVLLNLREVLKARPQGQ